jgi:TP901-1 family phage major tail protein
MPIRGVDVLINVWTGAAYETVAGQRGCTINLTADTLDATSKTDELTLAGWRSKMSGLRDWSMDFDGLLELADNAVMYLYNAFRTGDEVQVQISGLDIVLAGPAYITNFSIAAPHDDLTTVTGTLAGFGPLQEVSES